MTGTALTVDTLATALIDTTFVVVDLETTGLSPTDDRITEVGAVKVRGGEVLAEYRSLVHPGCRVPDAVTAATGVTDAMLAGAPRIEALLPSLLEFLGGAVVVAHNARFDVSFLRAAIRRHRGEPFDPVVVDTALLARRLVRDEVRDTRLATLAAHLRSRVVPDHRALTDARATVDVLHGLIERAGSYGATTLEDLRDLARATSERSYRRAGLVRAAPRAAGTYRFLGEDGEVLHVGAATDLHERLRTYFGRDPRRRTQDLVRDTASVVWDLTPTVLEAEVREVRAARTHAPRYDRRSRRPSAPVHVAVTAERFPRLAIVRRPGRSHTRTVGPLPSRRAAQDLIDAVHEVVPVRTCSGRLRAAPDHPACAVEDLGRCGARCDGSPSPDAYAAVVARLDVVLRDPAELLAGLGQRVLELAGAGRDARADEVRRRSHAAADVLDRHRRRSALAAVEHLVAARPVDDEVEVVVIRRGRLVGTARGPRVGSLDASAAAHVPTPTPELDGDASLDGDPVTDEEHTLLVAWLERPGVRLVDGGEGLVHEVAGGAAIAAARVEASGDQTSSNHPLQASASSARLPGSRPSQVARTR